MKPDDMADDKADEAVVNPAPASPRHRRAQLLAARQSHWRRTRAISALLLLVWLATSFCTVFFARDLAGLTVFGWPLSFYLAAQGASLISLAIIGAYALAMRAIDRRYHRQIASPIPKDD